MTKAEWHRRADFAEYAEALGVQTDEIIAVKPNEDPITVVYTTHTHDLDLALVHAAALRRRRDGVLTVESRRYVGTMAAWIRKLGLD